VDDLRYKTLADLSRILSLFEAPSVRELSMIEIARALQMFPSKASRMLRTLEAEGLFDRSPLTGKYRVSGRFLRLGLLYALNHPLRPIIFPYLQIVAADLSLYTGWGIFENGNVIVIDRIQVGGSPLIHLLGSDVPLHASAYGKLFLAYAPNEERERLIDSLAFTRLTPATVSSRDAVSAQLEEVRERGYALDVGETRANFIGLAAPILGSDEKILAAISVAGTGQKLPEERMPEVVDYLLNKTRLISRQLGYQG
jgi:DNA-binding IclR family transcriptional regulator